MSSAEIQHMNESEELISEKRKVQQLLLDIEHLRAENRELVAENKILLLKQNSSPAALQQLQDIYKESIAERRALDQERRAQYTTPQVEQLRARYRPLIAGGDMLLNEADKVNHAEEEAQLEDSRDELRDQWITMYKKGLSELANADASRIGNLEDLYDHAHSQFEKLREEYDEVYDTAAIAIAQYNKLCDAIQDLHSLSAGINEAFFDPATRSDAEHLRGLNASLHTEISKLAAQACKVENDDGSDKEGV